MSEHLLMGMLQKYRYAEVVKRDVMTILRSYQELQPGLENYVFNDGQSKELVRLKGTIPVNYRGNTYNIPIIIWLLDTHPVNSPICFVNPTPSMQIKPGKHVDANGRIYLPYLHDWRNAESDLQGLIQILCIVFGEESPVFSRQQGRQQYPVAQPRPPYPTSTAGYGMPMPGGNSAYNPVYSPSSTPYPPYPVATSSTPATSSPGYPPPNPPYPTNPGVVPAPSLPAAGVSADSGYNKQTQLSDDQIRASLLSAVEDKMKRRLREIFGQATEEMSALRRTQEELGQGKTKLETMISELDTERLEAEKTIHMLREKNEEIEKVVKEMEGRDNTPIDIDEAVITTAPLYKQLLNLFAEENAIEDANYYLSEGLLKGVISLDIFLKHVRELSRRQFTLRATIEKCRKRAGLD